jgi:hypothetical protein
MLKLNITLYSLNIKNDIMNTATQNITIETKTSFLQRTNGQSGRTEHEAYGY